MEFLLGCRHSSEGNFKKKHSLASDTFDLLRRFPDLQTVIQAYKISILARVPYRLFAAATSVTSQEALPDYDILRLQDKGGFRVFDPALSGPASFVVSIIKVHPTYPQQPRIEGRPPPHSPEPSNATLLEMEYVI